MPEDTSSMGSDAALAVCTGMEAIVAHAQSLLTTEMLPPASRGRIEAMRTIARYAIEVARSDPNRTTSLAAAGASTGRRETVLVIKDSVAVSDLLSRVLRARGYQVIEALTAERALDRLAEHAAPVDLALVDLTTPGMSADELVDRLRRQSPSLRVLFMSGHDASHVAARLVIDERTGFIPKPFVVEDLVTAIDDLMGRSA